MTRAFDDATDGTLQAVCFDLDDTLFDYTQYIRAGLCEAAGVLRESTGVDAEQELLDLYFEEGVRTGTFDVILERHDLSDAFVPALVEAYHDSSGPLRPYDNAERVLSELRPQYDLGLITDGRNARSKLRRLDLQGYFDVVFASPNHDVTKLDPEPFERTFEALGVDPSRGVYVGDNPETDFRHPNRLGMSTVRLNRGRYVDRAAEDDAEPDAVIDSLAPLLELLSSE